MTTTLLPRLRPRLSTLTFLRHASTTPKPRRPAVRPPSRPPPPRTPLGRPTQNLIPSSATAIQSRPPATDAEVKQVLQFLENLPDDALPPPPRSPLVLPFTLGGLTLLGLGIWMYTYTHLESGPYYLNPEKFSLYNLRCHRLSGHRPRRRGSSSGRRRRFSGSG